MTNAFACGILIQSKECHALKTENAKIGSICKIGNNKIAVGFERGYINLILVSSVKRRIYTIRAHSKYVLSLVFIEEQNTLISGSEDGYIKVWNVLETKAECLRRFYQQGTSILGFVVFQNKDLLISNHSDKSLILWRISTGQKISTYVDETFGEAIIALPNRDEIASANLKKLKVWILNI